MPCRKIFYAKLEQIHYKVLSIVFSCDATYDELRTINNKVSLDQKHLRLLATEIYKFISYMTPKFLKNYFNRKNITCNLRTRPGLSYLSSQLKLAQIQYYLKRI